VKNLYGWLALVLALSFLLIPLTAASPKNTSVQVNAGVQNETLPTKTIKVKITETGEINEMDVKEYLFGVVNAEMPALYHTEALKAQTVAAYTFALYKSNINKNEEYDITDSYKTDQAFKPREKALNDWGENGAEYAKKIDDVINEVYSQALTYDGKIILSLYTALSAGKTEGAEAVFGTALPYLVPKESIGDMLSPDYLSTAEMSQEEVAEILAKKGITADSNWFSEEVRTDSGSVASMKFGETVLTGNQLRDLFGLKSANFQISLKDGVYTFTVRGYGHLCGMSQYGANYMAMQGSSYKDILLWYYTNCEIVSVTAS
jgi:stage II sporulation protein D